ncbi:MAG: undecaprenyl/decaprenyl-phosphate alpha-N-acetylglucosaminyl 1-phosphate transferase [Clostridiaceae bacterium]|nr:undecaprenyl/decaprenyl-phosphate alpha-N-acetylglucosaminyl 1-phosphate transferase [Clostridiaceae bacterium]
MKFHHLVAFGVALIVSFFATPIARRLAVNLGAVNVPNDSRRVHKKPMPLMGGLAIIAGFIIALIYSFSTKNFKVFTEYLIRPKTIGLFFGTLIILVLGGVDDVRPVRARIKLPLQILAAVIVVSTGTSITAISKPFQDGVAVHPSMMFVLEDIIAYIVSVVWIVGVTNAINLIDGLDGLAAGVSGIATLSLYIVAVIRGQDDIAILAACLVGAILGFLPYNFNPAKIFMGDTGSTTLGFILAILSIEGTMKSVTALALAIPILVLGLPIFDTLFAIIRRILNGKPIGQADRGHIHHRLLDMGLSHRMAVIILYIISAALGIISIALVDKGLLPSITLLIILAVFGIGGARNLRELDDIPVKLKKVRPDENTTTEDIEKAQLEAASGEKPENVNNSSKVENDNLAAKIPYNNPE